MLAMLVFATAAFAQSRGPSGADGSFNCEDFDTQEQAQAVFDQDPSDPDGLDGPPGEAFTGEPGVACEELPMTEETMMEETMMEETMMEETMMEETMTEETMTEETMMEETVTEEPMMEESGALPDTGGLSLALLAGALLIGTGLMIRRR
jgi:hypothetical protein